MTVLTERATVAREATPTARVVRLSAAIPTILSHNHHNYENKRGYTR